jgi:hypothetical protein
MNRRNLLRLLARVAPLAAMTWITGCAGVLGPQVITLSEAELAGLINRAFPMQKRLLELLDVQLAAPRLRLLPERNRLALDLTLSTQERLSGKSARARLAFDSALRYAPGDATVRLTQVQVQRLEVEAGTVLATPPGASSSTSAGASPSASAAAAASAQAGAAGRIGNALAERVLEDLVIYRVSAERLASLRQLGLQPGAVTVTVRGLEITLARIPN